MAYVTFSYVHVIYTLKLQVYIYIYIYLFIYFLYLAILLLDTAHLFSHSRTFSFSLRFWTIIILIASFHVSMIIRPGIFMQNQIILVNVIKKCSTNIFISSNNLLSYFMFSFFFDTDLYRFENCA